MLLRLAYLAITNTFTAFRLLPMSDREKDAEILLLRHQITVLERQLNGAKVKFRAEDRAFVAALLASLPRDVLRRLRMLVRPDTVLRWHRDLIKQRHARTCRPQRPGCPRTVRSIRVLVLRLVRENPSWNERHLRYALHEFEQHHNAHPAPSSLEPGGAITRDARVSHRSWTNLPPGHPSTRPTRRSDPRAPACRLNCPDEIFGRRNVGAAAGGAGGC